MFFIRILYIANRTNIALLIYKRQQEEYAMWRKIYNAIWADKARRAAVLTIIIALIVSGTALAILNTIGKSKPAQGIPDEQPLIGTEVADLPQESSRNTNQETESQPADERQTEQSGEQYETPEVTGPSAQETSAGGNEQSSSKTADTQPATVSGETVSESGERHTGDYHTE
jgi:hypothetical protein